MRGADLLVKTLAVAGVTRIFSLSGNQIMPIYDACIDSRIEIIHTRHEAAAVFMADAWAQLTGQVGIALVTAAPGAANAMGPLYSARAAESPVVLLTGDSPLSQDGKGAFQELDQVAMSAPLTKLSFRAMSALELSEDMARAIRTAMSGRPGPVHVALPFDVVDGEISSSELITEEALEVEVLSASGEEIGKITAALGAAKTPLVLCGPAMNLTRSGEANKRLADALDAPVVAMESPRGLKDPSLGDFSRALAKADVVVSLGKPINFTVGFGGSAFCAPKCRWIVVDAEAREHDRARLNLGDRLETSIAVDPRAVVASLIEVGAGETKRAAWRAEVAGWINARGFAVPSPLEVGPITSAILCSAVQRHVADSENSVVVCDGGEIGQWAQACTQGDSRVINGPSGAIGGGICYAIAAKKARPEATVFALMGDGTAGFHFAEFETAARENTAFVAVIGNDECWNAEHQIQMREYGPNRLIGCQLSGARYDQAVEGLGGHGEYVTDASELDAALKRAIASDKPACVNVVIEGLAAPSGSAH